MCVGIIVAPERWIFTQVWVLIVFSFRHTQLLLSSVLPSVLPSSLPPSSLCDSETHVHRLSCSQSQYFDICHSSFVRGNMEVTLSILTCNAPHHIHTHCLTYILCFKETRSRWYLPKRYVLYVSEFKGLILNSLKCLKPTYSCYSYTSCKMPIQTRFNDILYTNLLPSGISISWAWLNIIRPSNWLTAWYVL